ncbi:hypothetical protein AJ79_01241 [Helicocarpus griseus UAMH5409]|uniref:A to I editase domain-containing protein n=1 Tax=Helicocarpus griseus UAMH5409 TaxID=1447875 RepID=A0A2B7Y9T1_9EURO|nr:hypothetical protein AJ79_01241 [Helicocarpus griseus UAMH5409]
MGDISLECRIASLVHSHFDALPKRSKPTIHPNGTREWVPLSGIVLVTGENTRDETLTCVAIATGAKCLSSSQIPQCQGVVLHDSHAEILAIRAFNHWLLGECKLMLHSGLNPFIDGHGQVRADDCIDRNSSAEHAPAHKGIEIKEPSRFLTWRYHTQRDRKALCTTLKTSDINLPSKTKLPWPPFELRKDVRIYMYGTCAPCGDASMELCMASQDDPTPWVIPPINSNSDPNPDIEAPDTDVPQESGPTPLSGRAHFSILGAVRRKPSRADAESTFSKSCSDKLAVKQVTSILTFPTSLLIAPSRNAYLTALLLPEEEISRVACTRAFGGGETGRLAKLDGRRWSDSDGGTTTPGKVVNEYAFFPFDVRSVPTAQVKREWAFAKPKDKEVKSKPGKVSAVWTAAPSPPASMSGKQVKTPTSNLHETLINGVKQGYRLSSPTPRKASALSRAKLWGLLADIVQLLPSDDNNDGDIANASLKGTGTEEGLDTKERMSLVKKLKECVLAAQSYEALKRKCLEAGFVKTREEVLCEVRNVLGNWAENRGDEDWGLEVLNEPSRAKKVLKNKR